MYTPLPLQLRKNTYDYIQVSRTEKTAIYSQWNNGVFVAYEVFEIQTQDATEYNGIKLEAKELFPNNERFGKQCYTCSTIERANIRHQQILNVIASRLTAASA